MKIFIKKLSIFSVCLIALLLGIHMLVANLNLFPYNWGNPMYQQKLVDLKTYKDVNTFFLGSSHFYRQIIPKQYDLATNGYSYNLGVQGLATPENYYLLENLLEEEAVTDAIIFIALSDLQSIAPKNMYTSRSTYFINNKILKQSLSIIGDETQFSFLTKTFRTFSFLGNYFYNTIGLAGFRSHFRESNHIEIDKIGSRGFLALDDDLSDDVQGREAAFKNQLAQFDKRIEKTKKTYAMIEAKPRLYNQSHYDYLDELTKKAEIKNNKLFFVIPPRKNDYDNVLKLASALPHNRIIDLANPEKYPEFYASENSFDIGHLNKKGAKIFTEKLADEYLKLKNL